MQSIQQQPALDTPAIEQHPMIEHMVESTVGDGPKKQRILSAVILGYLLSVGFGFTIAFLFEQAFNRPSVFDPDTTASLLRLGVPISILTAFLLGLILPALFARHKRLQAVFVTIILQFMTLVALIVLGLSQLPTTELTKVISLS